MLIPLQAMLAALVVVLLGALPLAAAQVMSRIARARRAAVTRQIAVTDAIHAALGAVVAPTVRRRLGGSWQLMIAVPFDQPDTVKRVVEIAYAAFDAPERAQSGRFELVLSPQAKPVHRRDRAALAACDTRGASVSWT